MIVHGVVLAIAGPFILVVGIILLEPLPIALGAVASVCAAWIIGNEARWWRELPRTRAPGAAGTTETLALGGPRRLRRPFGRSGAGQGQARVVAPGRRRAPRRLGCDPLGGGMAHPRRPFEGKSAGCLMAAWISIPELADSFSTEGKSSRSPGGLPIVAARTDSRSSRQLEVGHGR